MEAGPPSPVEGDGGSARDAKFIVSVERRAREQHAGDGTVSRKHKSKLIRPGGKYRRAGTVQLRRLLLRLTRQAGWRESKRWESCQYRTKLASRAKVSQRSRCQSALSKDGVQLGVVGVTDEPGVH